MICRCISLLVVLMVLPGCGTINNLNEERHPYGGVAMDFKAALHGSWFVGSSGMLAPQGIIDVPFSAVADTVTLPITIYSSLNRRYSLEDWYEDSKDELPISPFLKTPPNRCVEPQ